MVGRSAAVAEGVGETVGGSIVESGSGVAVRDSTGVSVSEGSSASVAVNSADGISPPALQPTMENMHTDKYARRFKKVVLDIQTNQKIKNCPQS